MRRLLLLGLLAVPATGSAGIRNTQHDLSSSSTAVVHNQDPSENEICVYCHTPHRAASTNFLWNHRDTTATSWTWGTAIEGFMTRTGSGTPLPSTLRMASKRCLACHDGSVAVGDTINSRDGVSGVVPGLANIGGRTDSTGRLSGSRFVTAPVTGGVGAMGYSHPVSIPYPGQTGYNNMDSGITPARVVSRGYYPVTTSGCFSPTGVCTTAPATDGRDGAGINLIPNVTGGTTNVGVECSTCHEPHAKYPWGAFMRIRTDYADGLCRSCHNW